VPHSVIYFACEESLQDPSLQPLGAQVRDDSGGTLSGHLGDGEGLIDAELGGRVVKKRVPLPGRGKSGSTRTLVATNKGSLWFFLFGFEKGERANVSFRELEALKALAVDLLKLTSAELDRLVDNDALEEICHGHKD
jgi:hypothetical protein